jgi:nitrous oxide reductase accessory protein NosL
MNRHIFRLLACNMIFVLVLNFNSTCRGEEEKTINIKKGMICRICGMYIERFKKTTAQVEFKNGKTYAYCGVSCAIRAINESGGEDFVKSAVVTGWTSQKPIDMNKAIYIIGSRLIPDMLPNIIAFDSKESAQGFMAKYGGKVVPLETLFVSTSYRGLTMPFRIPSAAVPGQGVFNAGSNFNVMRKDILMKGDRPISKEDAFRYRKMIPDTMNAIMVPFAIGYGVTDDIFCTAAIPYITKDMHGLRSQMKNPLAVRDNTTTRSDGIGDLQLNTRWRLWHDTFFDKHLGVLGAIGVPTGRFNNSLRDKPMLQTGNGSFSYTAGPLASIHIGDFWGHIAGTYTVNTTNYKKYKFGDILNYGFAIHWLPNTADLFALEFDTNQCFPNYDRDVKVENTGTFAFCCNLGYQRKIFLLMGGNMSFNALFGLPLYQHVKNVQLGESWHGSLGLQWQRKF